MIVSIILILAILLSPNVYANEMIPESIKDSFKIEEYITTLNNYLEKEELDISPNEIYESLIEGKSVKKENLIKSIIHSFIKEIKTTVKDIATIYLVVILSMLLNAISLDKDSNVRKVVNIIITCIVTIVLLKNLNEVIQLLLNTTKTITYMLELTSTLLTGALVATGKISTTGITQPLILTVNSAISLITKNIVVPLIIVSVVIKIVSQISVEMKLEKLADTFRKATIYIFSTLCTIYVLIMSLESNVSKDIDSIYYKTTQSVIKDTVPVVGGIFSDSLNTVIGATELIAKTGGTVAIICTMLIVSIPILKIVVIIGMYSFICGLSQPIESKYITDLIDYFSKVYKDILGIIIGECIIFISSIGIIMHMLNSL